MSEFQVTVRRVSLPDGPRGTMARLRADGGGEGDEASDGNRARGVSRYALLESALPMAGLAEWSYIAGPTIATLYTDETSTRLERAGREIGVWTDPYEALAAIARDGRLTTDTDINIDSDSTCPAGMNFVGGWVGALGYDLARAHTPGEAPVEASSDGVALPRQWWAAVDQVLGFHHPSGQWWHATVRGPSTGWPWTDAGREQAWDATLARACGPVPARRNWCAGPRALRTSRATFERDVQQIRDAITRGDVLQVNLTRREDASFSGDPWALYEDLVAANPVPFAAYLEGPGFAIASCSPERFLKRCGDLVEARPIKGTAPRGRDAAQDRMQRDGLAASIKDRAENVMIVDLMRNDLGRVAVIGSVQVPELFTLEPYASVWQMVSTVRARLRPECGVADLLRACWPPGSMTGAPKHKAMQIIEALEPLRRGWYSGSVGYLDCRGHMDLSVVIRTAVVAEGRVMLQLGGGIVADSEPASEWAETVAKGRLLVETLARGGG